MRTSSAILLACWFVAVTAQAQGFKFSNPPTGAATEGAAQAQRDATTAAQLATPCRERIRNRKILVLVGEEMNGGVTAPRRATAATSRRSTAGCRTWA